MKLRKKIDELCLAIKGGWLSSFVRPLIHEGTVR
jgi:hypothetical protein